MSIALGTGESVSIMSLKLTVWRMEGSHTISSGKSARCSSLPAGSANATFQITSYPDMQKYATLWVGVQMLGHFYMGVSMYAQVYEMKPSAMFIRLLK